MIYDIIVIIVIIYLFFVLILKDLLYVNSFGKYSNIPENNHINGFKHPSEYKHFHSYEDIMIKNIRDLKYIHVWILKQENPRKHPTMFYFHGNSGNIGLSLPVMSTFYDKLKVNIFMIEYSGYGHSHGVASEKNMYSNTISVWEYFNTRSNEFDVEKTLVYGRSLGASMAIFMTKNTGVKKMIIENGFHNLIDVIPTKILKFITNHPRIYNHCNNEHITSITEKPILILSSEHDNVVNPENSKKLFDCVKHVNSKTKHVHFNIPDAKHTNLWRSSKSDVFFEYLYDFIYYNN